MGQNQSTSVTDVTDVVMQSATNFVTQNSTNSLASESNTNDFELNILAGETVTGDCLTNVDQSITANQNVTVMAQAQNLMDFQNTLNTIIDNTLAQQNTAVNGLLASAFSNQSSSTDIQNTLHQTITTNVTNDNMTACNAVLSDINQKIINIGPNGTFTCPPGGSTPTIQSIAASQTAQCYSNAIQNALMQNTNIANAVNNANNSNSSTNTGVPTSLADLLGFSGLSPTTMIYLGFFILIMIIVYKYMGSSSSSSQTLPPFIPSPMPPIPPMFYPPSPPIEQSFPNFPTSIQPSTNATEIPLQMSS